jgi:hypothetical protein
VPLCRSATETGCVITYVSFRASSPPPPGSRFAQVPEADMEAGCTDPGKLSGAPIRTILPTHINLLGDSDTEHAWDKMADIIDTPFVTLTGLIETRCVSDAHGSYLAVSIHSAPGDLRPHDIPGDLYYQGHLVATWGLHLVDVNLAMGNLIDIVRRQAQAYQGRHPQKKERSRVGAGAPSGQ